MLLYKKAATINNNKEEKYIEELNKISQKQENSSNLKKAFF